MEKENNKKSKYIKTFNPDVCTFHDIHQDFLPYLKEFDAGNEFKNFNDFISKDAYLYAQNGDGVTYVVWNIIYDKHNNEISRDIVAYYTLAVTSIPYEDRIRLDDKEAAETGRKYDIEICGIPSLEIKMFAVDKKYQDTFFTYENETLPISAWIIRSIISHANTMLVETVGFKALFLHSLPNAKKFYLANKFNCIKPNMQPLYSIDSEYCPMYLSLKDVCMNYDD